MRCQISKWSSLKRDAAEEPAAASFSKRQALQQINRVLAPSRISHALAAKKKSLIQTRKQEENYRERSFERTDDVEEREQPAEVSSTSSASLDDAERSYADDSSSCYSSDDDDDNSSSQLPDIELSLICTYEDDEDSDSIRESIPEVSFDASSGDIRDDDEISVLSSNEANLVDDFDFAIFQCIYDPFPDVEVDVDFRPVPRSRLSIPL